MSEKVMMPSEEEMKYSDLKDRVKEAIAVNTFSVLDMIQGGTDLLAHVEDAIREYLNMYVEDSDSIETMIHDILAVDYRDTDKFLSIIGEDLSAEDLEAVKEELE